MKTAITGHPQTDAIAKLVVGTQTGAIRVATVNAGQPGCFWSFVGPTQGMNENLRIGEDNTSVCLERCDEHFTGP